MICRLIQWWRGRGAPQRRVMIVRRRYCGDRLMETSTSTVTYRGRA